LPLHPCSLRGGPKADAKPPKDAAAPPPTTPAPTAAVPQQQSRPAARVVSWAGSWECACGARRLLLAERCAKCGVRVCQPYVRGQCATRGGACDAVHPEFRLPTTEPPEAMASAAIAVRNPLAWPAAAQAQRAARTRAAARASTRVVSWTGRWQCACGSRLEMSMYEECAACGEAAPCRNYLRGICALPSCRFPHPLFEPPPSSPKPAEGAFCVKLVPTGGAQQPRAARKEPPPGSAPPPQPPGRKAGRLLVLPSSDSPQPPTQRAQPEAAARAAPPEVAQPQAAQPPASSWLPWDSGAGGGGFGAAALSPLLGPGPRLPSGGPQVTVVFSPDMFAEDSGGGDEMSSMLQALGVSPEPPQWRQALVHSLDSELGGLGPGLVNETGEYNCFLNVVVQCLWHCSDFSAAVTAWPPEVYARDAVVAALHSLFASFAQQERERRGAGAGGAAPAAVNRAVVNPLELREALSAMPGANFKLGERPKTPLPPPPPLPERSPRRAACDPRC
jgi:hypothetical protein